ncbi:hypothetical protein [Silvanigrella aquatica]|nr:hypothetical protein [Silvanigrella aquatica]
MSAYLFNYFHWRSLIFPYQVNFVNKILYLLRMGADKIPFITLSLVFVEKFNLPSFYTGILTFFFGIARLASTYDWRATIPKIKKWRLELGLLYNNPKFTFNQDKNIFDKLARPNQNNKFEISKADFRCYVALSLLFVGEHLYQNGNHLQRLDLISFFLIAWCSFDALMWNYYLHHKPHSFVENFQEKPSEFFGQFWIRIFALLFCVFFFFITHYYIGHDYSRYNLAVFIFLFMFLNKILRIWNEGLIAKLNMQKEYYPASYHRDHLFKFENARIWRDIGAQRSDAVNPFVRLVMFRTMFELSERSLFIGIITHLDLIFATFFYTILVSK